MRSQRKSRLSPTPRPPVQLGRPAPARPVPRTGEEQAELQYNRHLILDQAALLPFMAQTNRNSRQRHRKGHGTQLTGHARSGRAARS